MHGYNAIPETFVTLRTSKYTLVGSMHHEEHIFLHPAVCDLDPLRLDRHELPRELLISRLANLADHLRIEYGRA